MRIALTVLIAALCFSAQADDSLQDIPGSIPLDFQRGIATDLVDSDGNPLFPEDLVDSGDLSRLNPATSDIWAPTPLKEVPTVDLKTRGEELEWVGDITSAITWQTFLVKPANNSGSNQFYNILLSRKAHNVLMRARLLQKLGYRVPNIKYLKTFRLTFPTKALRDDFLNITMIDQLDALPSRWVKNVVKTTTNASDEEPGQVVWKVTSSTEDCFCLEFQDAVAFNSTTHIYNFPIGVLSQEVMQGRRAFEALLIPFGLTYVDESFNMLSWEFGKVRNDRLFVNYEYNHQFYPNYDDAKWIARKILKLSRNDWQQVVAFGDYPTAVEKLAVEKFISRRNSLIPLFHLQKEFSPMKFNPRVSHQEMGTSQLYNGKLVQLEWPGYAPTFGFGDPESPLNNAELFAFLKSKVISNGISFLVSQFNSNFMPRTDISAKVAEKQYDMLLDTLVESALKGKPAEVPFGYFVVPYMGMDLIASREIVTGQIMGTENPIQISHTIGFSVNAGAYVGFHGLPQNTSGDVRLGGYITRTYSHLKPVTNIKVALNQPYKNIAVNFLAKEIGETMSRVYEGEFDDLSKMKGDKKKQLETELVKVFSDFDNVFNVGESLILSDYVGAMGTATFGYGLGELSIGDIKTSTRAYTRAKAEMKLLTRLHIYRKSKDVIQIYDDKGQVVSLNLSLGIDLAGERFVGIDMFANVNGKAKTKFTQLNMTTEKNDQGELVNDQLVDNMKIMYRLFTSFNKEGLYAKREPTLLTHNFSEKGFDYKLFWHEGKYIKSMNDIVVNYDNEVGRYIRATRGFRSGNNWEGFGIGVSNGAINELLTENEITISSNTGSDPGHSFKGKSRARRVVFEAQVWQNNRLVRPFAMVEHRWRGWAASRGQLAKIIEEINRTYPVGNTQPTYFRKWDLKDVKLLQLYSVYLTLNVYGRGLEALRRTPHQEIRKAFHRAAAAMPDREFRGSGKDRDLQNLRRDWAQNKTGHYIKLYNRINTHLKAGRVRNGAAAYRDLLEYSDRYLLWPDLLRFVGGKENVFIQSRINGFRMGDEQINPDTGFHEPFFSNTFGVIGSRQVNGPMSFIRENLGMTESEAFLYWIMENL